ncbi:6-phosphogluconate dehydrogenase domain protein [Mycobacterium xenopi 3993]|nr:6-phosphogluconate dehydrogenase domain protein [Mycobacterium xenopi 3993]
MQIALFGLGDFTFPARCARAASTPGATVAKIGSACATASASPPIIRQ